MHLGRPPLLSKLVERAKLYLYLIVSEEVVSVTIIGEARFSINSGIKKTKTLLPCTLDRSLNKLPATPGTPKV